MIECGRFTVIRGILKECLEIGESRSAAFNAPKQVTTPNEGDSSRRRLLNAAARVKDICDRYSLEIRNAKITGRPFDDIVIVIADDGRKATRCHLEDHLRIFGVEKNFALPKDISERLDQISERAFVAYLRKADENQ